MALLFSLVVVKPCPCQEKSRMVGVDLNTSIRGSVCINAGYGFGEHWSASGDVSISYDSLVYRKNKREQEHDAQFSDRESSSSDSRQIVTAAMVSYWPKTVFSGPYLSIGAQSRMSAGIITEAGYVVPVWKGINLSMAIRLSTTRGMHQSHDVGNIRIGIHYRY